MMTSGHIGFIGAGNMAEAIIRGLVGKQVVPSGRIVVSDPSEARRTLLVDSFGVTAVEGNRKVLEASDIVVLAVKPQIMAEALAPVADAFRANQLVVSIAAGIRTDTIDGMCSGKPSIIRVMPNTPALVGKGVSALCAGPRAGEEHLRQVESLLSAVGTTLRVDESQMDAVTAISGSGPAYVFYLMEAMLSAAAELGFTPDKARQLVYGTLSGSAALADASVESPDVLRSRVTSKGGTTEAAIKLLDSEHVRHSLVSAFKAAAQRSKELSQLA